MIYTYDTEFLEDGKTIELISIAIRAQDGREYYAVNEDMPVDDIRRHDWLMKNVVPHLPLTSSGVWKHSFPSNEPPVFSLDPKSVLIKPLRLIRNEVEAFFADDEEVVLWGYFSAYDHVRLMQLWGPMMDKPRNLPMYTRDFKQVMDERGLHSDDMPAQEDGEHDARADARWNEQCLRVLGIWS